MESEKRIFECSVAYRHLRVPTQTPTFRVSPSVVVYGALVTESTLTIDMTTRPTPSAETTLQNNLLSSCRPNVVDGHTRFNADSL